MWGERKSKSQKRENGGDILQVSSDERWLDVRENRGGAEVIYSDRDEGMCYAEQLLEISLPINLTLCTNPLSRKSFYI